MENIVKELLLDDGYILISTDKYRINIQDEFEFYPSEILSKIIGLNIYREWGINTPDNKKKEIGKNKLIDRCYMPKNYKVDIEHLYSNFPELKTIKGYCSSEIIDWYIYNGCLSKFNFEDIKYFCEVPYDKRPNNIELLQAKLEKRLNFSFQFVPSIETLRRIDEHLKHNRAKVNEKILLKTFQKTF